MSFIPKLANSPVPYTGSPLRLCISDLKLFIKLLWSLPGILHPINKPRTGALDELYPSIPNLCALALHTFLILLQATFLISLPGLVLVPVWMALAYVVAVMSVNLGVARVLNGKAHVVRSRVDLSEEQAKGVGKGERWIYLNGVSIGHHWLQNNADRLAYTFRRPITGIHNRTYGIIFDLIQCIIERNFCYATGDIRRSYAVVKDALLDEGTQKVILILHSQGGIEGGLILDWLLSELSWDAIHKLEIYTFGSASNHFNNPIRHSGEAATARKSLNAVRHIEHYAAGGEFVARWGVLHFASMDNRYMGRVFMRPGTGHLLNQHYLNWIFPLNDDRCVVEENSFMEMDVSFAGDGAEGECRRAYWETILGGGDCYGKFAVIEDRRDGVEILNGVSREEVLAVDREVGTPKVKDFSRLWAYRNGKSPRD